MCAAQAGYRGRSVLVLDNAKKPGRKILISGGGRCNFTNHQAGPTPSSANPTSAVGAGALHPAGLHRSGGPARAALSREDARPAVLRRERQGDRRHPADRVRLGRRDPAVPDRDPHRQQDRRGLHADHQSGDVSCHSLVVATGGLSMPKLGATYGFKLAEQFGLRVLPTRAGLVPFTLHQADKGGLRRSGRGQPAGGGDRRGWHPLQGGHAVHPSRPRPGHPADLLLLAGGEKIHINLLPELDIPTALKEGPRPTRPRS